MAPANCAGKRKKGIDLTCSDHVLNKLARSLFTLIPSIDWIERQTHFLCRLRVFRARGEPRLESLNSPGGNVMQEERRAFPSSFHFAVVNPLSHSLARWRNRPRPCPSTHQASQPAQGRETPPAPVMMIGLQLCHIHHCEMQS